MSDESLKVKLSKVKQALLLTSREEQETRLVSLLHACMFDPTFNPYNEPLDRETRSKMYAEFSMWYAMLVMTGKLE